MKKIKNVLTLTVLLIASTVFAQPDPGGTNGAPSEGHTTAPYPPGSLAGRISSITRTNGDIIYTNAGWDILTNGYFQLSSNTFFQFTNTAGSWRVTTAAINTVTSNQYVFEWTQAIGQGWGQQTIWQGTNGEFFETRVFGEAQKPINIWRVRNITLSPP